MPVRSDEAWKILRFGNDSSAAIQVTNARGIPSICLSNRPPHGLSWNLLDAEVFVFCRIKLAHDQGLAWSVSHWLGSAHWRERKQIYEEIYQRLDLKAEQDVWDMGDRIYEDLRRASDG